MNLDLLMERVRATGAPLIEGETVTFVWLGESAPGLIGDFNDWNETHPLTLQQLAPGIWVRQERFPHDAYLEYSYLDGEQRLSDPLNARQVYNGVGSYNNYFYMPAAQPSYLLQFSGGGLRGTVTRHTLASNFLLPHGRRSVYLYQPPVSEPCPLLVVWDGREYLQRGKLAHIVDALIALGRIRPLALALVNNAGRGRMTEYACSEITLTFLQEMVLPLARQHLNLLDPVASPGAYGVMGASMGGLMALYTALRLPQLFGYVLSQSGAFNIFGRDMVVFDLIRQAEHQTLRLALQVGRYDFHSLIPANQIMRALLMEKGYAVSYLEFPAGHNYTAWRDHIQPGLEFLFGKESGEVDESHL